MSDPVIINFERPLSADEREEIGKVNFSDYGFNLGVLFWMKNKKSGHSSHKLPEEIA